MEHDDEVRRAGADELAAFEAARMVEAAQPYAKRVDTAAAIRARVHCEGCRLTRGGVCAECARDAADAAYKALCAPAAQGEAVHEIAGRIAAAVLKDEQEDGCDISAGLFGAHFSALIRELAAARRAPAAQGEAVAWMRGTHDFTNDPELAAYWTREGCHVTPLMAAPAPASAQGLTPERIDWLANTACAGGVAYPHDVKRAIESALLEACTALAQPASQGRGLDQCLRAVNGHEREIRMFAVWCARQVEHLMTDQRSKDALNVAELHAKGQATDAELAAAAAEAMCASAEAEKAADRVSTWDAAWSATWEAFAAARAAARAVTGDAFAAAKSAAFVAAWRAHSDAAMAKDMEAAKEAWAAAIAAATAAQEAELRRVCAVIETKEPQ